ncbi:class I SAM-dependent methyltransferase [Parashewanella spongiae]|uniref:Class I SAM-dependent methyltransferase n=1 Tax=Parashewanella spongiae TaxID=342950 RepID=A0A3A6U1T1_9GAMM|nr:class I SAM-dependent methyltransferase [Parashewanella spongiae]MCL1079125.1 class I SAM-dependent methyltransferase [Parashewanella spongiae]RJY19388.1 class I SAM-dependent methyltransferase [Parashewanella spongiae]
MEYLEINKDAWNKRTRVHVDSKFYDVEGFLNGKCSLNPIELEQVGCVSGKELLHLQCHFGQDTLSWARRGAKVTGVDLSSQAITQAQKLSEELNLNAEFICDDIYHFGEVNEKKFDIVFTSYGVLCWLPDLDLWAQTIAKSLKQGGQFNLVEFHAFHDVLSGYSYFKKETPDIESEGTYTENCSGEESTVITWPHSLSEIINALIGAGISIESLQEYPYSPYNCFEGLQHVDGKGYVAQHKGQQIPLVYSITGRKGKKGLVKKEGS